MPWYTEDFRTLVLVFCIDDVPVTSLNNFLDEAFDLEYDSYCFRIVDDLNLDAISRGHDSKNPVPDDFISPFSGWKIEKVKKWFIKNVRQKLRDGFVNRNFIVIDKHVQSLKEDDDDEDDEDSGTVILCDAQTRMFKTVRVESPLVMLKAVDLDMKVTMREGCLGVFWRSGTTCTVHGSGMVSKNGIYFHKGVPEIDEEWRAFAQEWRSGGPHDYESSTDSDESEAGPSRGAV